MKKSKYSANYKDEKISVQNLIKGDHIYVPGNNSNGVKLTAGSALYYHHGIYIGDDCIGDVVDFGAVNKTRPVRRPLQDFLGENGAFHLFRREYKDCVPPDETVEHAIELLSESATWEPYDLVKNNCEHFATLLKVQIHWSNQAAYGELLMELIPFGQFDPALVASGILSPGVAMDSEHFVP